MNKLLVTLAVLGVVASSFAQTLSYRTTWNTKTHVAAHGIGVKVHQFAGNLWSLETVVAVSSENQELWGGFGGAYSYVPKFASEIMIQVGGGAVIENGDPVAAYLFLGATLTPRPPATSSIDEAMAKLDRELRRSVDLSAPAYSLNW